MEKQIFIKIEKKYLLKSRTPVRKQKIKEMKTKGNFAKQKKGL